MRTSLLVLFASLLLGTSLAQAAFPDVPAGHWAEYAVGRVADECVIVGLPQGDFRGDETLTRYQVAAVAGRLLDAVDRRLQALRLEGSGLSAAGAELAALAERIQGLAVRIGRVEDERETAYLELEGRLDALEAEVARLRAAIEGRTAPAAHTPTPPASAPAEPSATVDGAGEERFAAVPTSATAPSLAGPARPWRVGLALGAAPQGGPLLRAVVDHEDVLGFAGLRATVEVSFDGAGVGDVALAAHLTRRTEPRRFGATCWSGYAGVGAGYRIDGGDTPPGEAFLGAVLGSEYALDDRLGLFVEAAVDYHPGTGAGDLGVWASPVRPSLAAGVNFRF